MTVVVSTRRDLSLGNYERVAWGGEAVELASGCLQRMEGARKAFLALLDSDPDIVVYGTTSGAGDRARFQLSREEREAHARTPPRRGTSWGEAFPARVVRGIVFARLANWVDGHGAVRPEVAIAVARMLDGRPLPQVPMVGNGGSGEVIALGHLFAQVGEDLGGTEPKEPMAFINGSPCAASMVADCALRSRRLLDLAHHVLGLSAEAMSVPLEAYDEALEELWGDEHESAALAAARQLLHGGSPSRLPFQAPVSWRIVPRVLGNLHRAVARAEQAATISLRSVSDNPVFIPPDRDHPRGRAFSTGGYHNAMAYPAIDELTASAADLTQLCERQVERFFAPTEQGVATGLPIGYMVQSAWAEDARSAAQTTLMGLGGLGQNDTPAPTSFAYVRALRVWERFESALTVLAAVSSEALARATMPAPPALAAFMEAVRARFPVGLDRGEQSAAAASLNEYFTACTHTGDWLV
ncbi:MAG: aromatic amino acid lyase [Acidimicrobiales bacterium]